MREQGVTRREVKEKGKGKSTEAALWGPSG